MVPITYEGTDYPSVEHAFQAAKCRYAEDKRQFYMTSPRMLTAPEAKKVGGKVDLRRDWEEVKLQVMLDLLRAKFTQNRTLRQLLLSTRDATLVEGNWWGDTFWGVCNGRGENHLGKLLMQVRDELRS
jgi:ribA/ribD-fused uncharacterized protein